MNKRQKIHNQVFYYGLVLVAITLPFSLLANSLSMMIVVLNWIAEGNYSQKIKSIKNNFLFFLFILFYFLYIMGMFYTTNMRDGLFELQKKIPLLVFPVILATSCKLSLTRIENIMKLFFCSILTASLICLGYAAYRTNIFKTYDQPDWLSFSYKDLTAVIRIQHTYLALYVSFSIFILFYFLIKNYSYYNWLKKICSFFLVFYFTIFLFLLASRITIAALIIISFSGIIYWFYKKHKLFKGFLVLSIISLSLITIIFQLPFMKERFLFTLGIEQKTVLINQYGDGKNVTPEMRPFVWQCAWNGIRSNWFLGVGTGDVQETLQAQYKNINLNEAYNAEYNAHNQYIETWLGLGIIGLLSLLACMVAPIILAFRQMNYIYLSFILLFFICCFTESLLCRQQGVVFYALFNSVFAFHYKLKNHENA